MFHRTPVGRGPHRIAGHPRGLTRCCQLGLACHHGFLLVVHGCTLALDEHLESKGAAGDGNVWQLAGASLALSVRAVPRFSTNTCVPAWEERAAGFSPWCLTYTTLGS